MRSIGIFSCSLALLSTSLLAEVRQPSARDLFEEAPAAAEVTERQVRLAERADELERQAAAAPAPTARELAPRFVEEEGPKRGKMIDPPAARASSLTFDGWVGYLPRSNELKLGVAWVPAFANGEYLRGQLQVGENVIGPALGFKLPLRIFTEALSISVGVGVLWDVQRDEVTTNVYVARLVF